MLLSRLVFLYLVVVYFISGLFINCLQLLVLPLFWLYPNLYRAIIHKLCYLIYSHITLLGDWWGNVDLHVYASKEDIEILKKQNIIVVINHYSDIDWLVGWMIGERLGILSTSKVYMKDILKYVPTLGWAWWFAEYLFVKRDWASDQKYIRKALQKIVQNKFPYTLTLFCEGTRCTDAKLKASREYAMRNNIQPLKHHLLPRTKGFAITVQELKSNGSWGSLHFVNYLYGNDGGCCAIESNFLQKNLDGIISKWKKSGNTLTKYVCNLQLGFPRLQDCNVLHLINRGTAEVHVHIRCIPIANVPSLSMAEASQYCHELYKEKDTLMDYFQTKGKFPGDLISVPRRKWNLLTVLVHCILVFFLLSYLAAIVLFSLSTFQIIVFCIGFALSVFSVYKVLLTFTQTHKGTSFGLNAEK